MMTAANLRDGSLNYVDLTLANLRGADLANADLTGGLLAGTKFNKKYHPA